jgi:hypothetical protein
LKAETEINFSHLSQTGGTTTLGKTARNEVPLPRMPWRRTGGKQQQPLSKVLGILDYT